MNESVSNQGGYRAAGAAKNVKVGLNCDVCTVCNVRGYLWVQGRYLGVWGGYLWVQGGYLSDFGGYMDG